MAIAPDQIRRPRDLSQIIDGAISLYRRTFGILLIVGLLVAVVSGALSMILVLVPHEASTLLNAVVGVIVTPFGVIASTLLFFDLSSRESQDVSVA